MSIHWWRELTTQVLPPMMEDEMIKWFIDNLKPLYYEKMINAHPNRNQASEVSDLGTNHVLQ